MEFIDILAKNKIQFVSTTFPKADRPNLLNTIDFKGKTEKGLIEGNISFYRGNKAKIYVVKVTDTGIKRIKEYGSNLHIINKTSLFLFGYEKSEWSKHKPTCFESRKSSFGKLPLSQA